MIRQFLVAHVTSLPHNGLGGMTYFEMSSKLNRMRFEEVERFCGECRLREPGLREVGDIREELELREFGTPLSNPSEEAVDDKDADEGADDITPEMLDASPPPAGGTAMSPSGTW
jgi:hypothetical protein